VFSLRLDLIIWDEDIGYEDHAYMHGHLEESKGGRGAANRIVVQSGLAIAVVDEMDISVFVLQWLLVGSKQIFD